MMAGGAIMKTKNNFILFSVVYGLCIWFIDGVLHYAFEYKHHFLESLIKGMQTHELVSRILVLVSIIGFGVLGSCLMQKLTETNRSLSKSEEELRKSNAMLQKVVDGISDPLIMMDRLLQVKALNKAAREYYGVSSVDECIGRRCFEALRGKTAPCEDCKYPFLFSNRQPMIFERKGSNGTNKFEQVVVYPLSDDMGGMDGAIVRISDITQAKLFERQVLQNEKLASVGLLVSGVAHEINNPNTFISFNIPILRDYLNELLPIIDEYALDHPDFEVCFMSYGELRSDIFKLLKNIEHGSARINTIVSTLKEFVKKRDKPELRSIDLKLVVDRAVAMCMGEIKKKIKHFKVSIPDETPIIVSDSEAVEQILINLLINAIQASDKPESSLKVSVIPGSSPEGSCFIEVKDNGVGMDEQVRSKIFDPFFTTKSSPSGTGLGLYVSYNLLETLGGNIEVESEPGKGSTFRIVLNANGETRESRTNALTPRLVAGEGLRGENGANCPDTNGLALKHKAPVTLKGKRTLFEPQTRVAAANVS
jgi:PAS domain S-box-containing protein